MEKEMAIQYQIGDATQPSVSIRYETVREGLSLLRAWALESQASVHMPRIGCGLAGGTWDVMGPLVEECLQGISVTVHDLA